MVREERDIVTNVQAEKKSLLERYGIPIEHLSYEYISRCSNYKELERIILILRSGEEGHYPDLTKRAEEHLAGIKPTSRVLRKAQAVIRRDMLELNEREEIDSDIYNWTREMQCREKDLEEGKATLINDSFPWPDIRRVKETATKKKTEDCTQQKKSSKRISACDYASWDKYDVDTEIKRIELREEQEKVKAKEMQRREEAQRTKTIANAARAKNLPFTSTELNVMATQEREKGNEAFRAGDYEEALLLYNSSIAIDENPITFNNRAITHIKLRRYKDGLNDCDKVLSTDRANVKALLRRALCLECLEKNSQALADYEAVLKFEPTNKVAITGVGKLRKPCKAKKVRMKIEENYTDEKEQLAGQQMTSVQKKDVDSLDSCAGFDARCNICFCNRAPGSSKDPEPLPHIKTNYCVDTSTMKETSCMNTLNGTTNSSFHENKKDNGISLDISKTLSNVAKTSTVQNERSIFTCKKPSTSKVIIEELPAEPIEDKIKVDKPCPTKNKDDTKNAANVANGNVHVNPESRKSSPVRKSRQENRASASKQKNKNNRREDDKTNRKTQSAPAELPRKIDVAPKYENHTRTSHKIIPNDFQNVKSPYEFLRAWQSLKNDSDLTLHAQLLGSLKPEDYNTIIGNKLDGAMFTVILRCLRHHFCVPSETDKLNRILKCISELNRFQIVSMFMDSSDKEALTYIFKFLEEQRSSELISLRQVYDMK